MFKIKKRTSTPNMPDLFKMKRPPCYNLRNDDNFYIQSVNNVFNGLESISFPGPKNPSKDKNLRATHVGCVKYIYKISGFVEK